MKKMFLVLVVLLLVAPAMAEVKITCEQNLRAATASDANIVTVSYVATSEVNLPRAFALDITLADTGTIGGAVITSVTAAKTGESAVGSQGYGIFLGSDGIDINGTTGAIEYGRGFGSPVANPADPCAATGIGTNKVTVELGSLYGGVQGVSNPNAPAQSGVLCTFRVNNKISNVTITLNQRRGGIVMEDPDQVVDVNLPGTGATAVFAIKCPADMIGFRGAPPDGKCNANDYALLAKAENWNQTPPANLETDITGFRGAPPDGTCNSNDYQLLAKHWNEDWN